MSSASAVLTLSARRKGEALLWGLICVLLAFWTFGLFLCFSTDDPQKALFWAQSLNYIIIFLPALLFHFCVLFVEKRDYYGRIITLYYILCFAYFLLVFSYPERFLHSPAYRFSEFWFPYAGSFFYVFPVLQLFPTGHAIQLLISSRSPTNRTQQRKIHYLLMTICLGFIGAGSTLALEFGVDLPPYGIFSVAFVVLIATYAILRHDLLDLPETFSLITARVLIYIAIFAVVVSVIKVGAFFDDLTFSTFQIAVISSLMVLICELYAIMKTRVQFLSDKMLTRRKQMNDRQFKRLIKDLESASDFESMLPLLRAFFERQHFIYHYAWYLDQALLGQSLKKESVRDFEQNQNLDENTYQRILFSSRDGRRHDRLPASLRMTLPTTKQGQQKNRQITSLMNSEQLEQAYEWVAQVPGRELIALPLKANHQLRGLVVFVVSQNELEYSDQTMLQTLSAKLAIVIERFDAIRQETKRQQAFLLEKMTSLKELAKDIAYEMQQPLTQMDLFVSGIYGLSRALTDQTLDTAQVASRMRSDSQEARVALERSLQQIDIILHQVQGADSSISGLDVYSIQSLVSKTLAEYVFMSGERSFISCDLQQDFSCKVEERLLMLALFNVMKMALSQIEYPKGFEIYISTSMSDRMNWLSVRFNHKPSFRKYKHLYPDIEGVGIQEQSPNLGMVFCHQVMKSFSGELCCIAHGEDSTELLFGFPKLQVE